MLVGPSVPVLLLLALGILLALGVIRVIQDQDRRSRPTRAGWPNRLVHLSFIITFFGTALVVAAIDRAPAWVLVVITVAALLTTMQDVYAARWLAARQSKRHD